jgi:predicted  nucleic acid-binding Zn-ribbon protein
MEGTIDALIELASIEYIAQNKHLAVEGGVQPREERRILRRLLPAVVLATYDALVRAGRHPAIVETQGGLGGGCHVRLPEKLACQVGSEKNLFACPSSTSSPGRL